MRTFGQKVAFLFPKPWPNKGGLLGYSIPIYKNHFFLTEGGDLSTISQNRMRKKPNFRRGCLPFHAPVKGVKKTIRKVTFLTIFWGSEAAPEGSGVFCEKVLVRRFQQNRFFLLPREGIFSDLALWGRRGCQRPRGA